MLINIENFLNIIDWLYRTATHFGVDHVVVLNKIYWLDSNKDRQALYDIWVKYNKLEKE